MTSISQRQASSFVVKALLGIGAFGKVYRVRHAQTEKEHALKLIECKAIDKVAAAFQEIILLIKTRAPNVINIDFYFLKELPGKRVELGIIMELGLCSLEQYLRLARAARRPPRQAHVEAMLAALLGTLALLERQNICHRDIKPANVILCGNEVLTPKLADFGLASVVSAEYDTRSGGSLDYAAPKLRQLLEGIHLRYSVPKSDVYSLGLTFLQACTLSEVKGKRLNTSAGAELVSKLLTALELRYAGSWLPPLLRAMLEPNEDKRPTFEELLKGVPETTASLPSARQFFEGLPSSLSKQQIYREIPGAQRDIQGERPAGEGQSAKLKQKLKYTVVSRRCESVVLYDKDLGMVRGDQHGGVSVLGLERKFHDSPVTAVGVRAGVLATAELGFRVLTWHVKRLLAGNYEPEAEINLKDKFGSELGISAVLPCQSGLLVGFCSGRVAEIGGTARSCLAHVGRVVGLGELEDKFVSVGDDGFVKFICKKTFQPLVFTQVSVKPITACAIEGGRLLAGDEGGAAFVLQLQELKEVARVQVGGPLGWISGVAWQGEDGWVLSSDGRLARHTAKSVLVEQVCQAGLFEGLWVEGGTAHLQTLN